jgi:hypothetical protein
MLSYMHSKATSNDIEFDFVIGSSIDGITESDISKGNLETLLADLIENAIIATSFSSYKRILITVGVAYGCLEITILDSGIPFDVKTLVILGLENATTHADSGSCGIGYMTVFEILSKTNASIIISEHADEPYSFTKTIRIRFDGKHEYIIKSSRANEIKLSTNRKNMHIFEKD